MHTAENVPSDFRHAPLPHTSVRVVKQFVIEDLLDNARRVAELVIYASSVVPHALECIAGVRWTR